VLVDPFEALEALLPIACRDDGNASFALRAGLPERSLARLDCGGRSTAGWRRAGFLAGQSTVDDQSLQRAEQAAGAA
jgi:hypothetical protein